MTNPNTKIIVFEHNKNTGDGFSPGGYIQLWQLRGCPMWPGKVGSSSHEVLYRLDDELGFQCFLIEARDPPRPPKEEETWHTPPEDPSGYDPNYKAVILSPAEARSWLTRNSHEIPEYLAESPSKEVIPHGAEQIEVEDVTERGPEAHLEENAFRKAGDFWEVSFRSNTFLVKDSKGMAYIAYLLQTPNTPISVVELTPPGRKPRSQDQAKLKESETMHGVSRLRSKILDNRALRDLGRRLREMEEALAEADRDNDRGRKEKLAVEKEQLLAELHKACRPNGSSKNFIDELERFRKRVSMAIVRALNNIKHHNKDLYHHFHNSIQCGIFCQYTPDTETRWAI
jgi:hypothetical protein